MFQTSSNTLCVWTICNTWRVGCHSTWVARWHNFVARCVLLQHTAVSHCSGTPFSKKARTWCFINLVANPAAVKNRLNCADSSHSLGITWSRLVCNYKHVPSKSNNQDPHCWHSEISGQGKCKKGHGSNPLALTRGPTLVTLQTDTDPICININTDQYKIHELLTNIHKRCEVFSKQTALTVSNTSLSSSSALPR